MSDRATALLQQLYAEAGENFWMRRKVKGFAATKAILAADPLVQIDIVRATVERAARAAMQLGNPEEVSHHYWNICDRTDFPLAGALAVAQILSRVLPLSEADALYLANRTADVRVVTTFGIPYAAALVACLERYVVAHGINEALRGALRRLADALGFVSNAPERKLMARVLRLAGGPRQLPLETGEAWADEACRAVQAGEARRNAWLRLLTHALEATTGAPSKKWLDQARGLIDQIGRDAFKTSVRDWLALVDKPRTAPLVTDWRWEPQPEWAVVEPNANALKGLAWCCSLREDSELARSLTALALSSYRKIPGIGPRLVRVGNACIWALGAMPGREGLGQLALLKVRVKFGTAQRLIEKALTAAAERIGLPRDEIEELAVPTYGLEDVGLRRERLGDYTAELAITGTSSTELCWRKADGRLQKSVPAAVKTGFIDNLKELKQAAKDIQKMLPAQRERLDQLFLARKSWVYPVWRERYLDHPLVGTLARRLIWTFTRGQQAADAIFTDGRLVDRANEAVGWPDGDTQVELWHPIARPVEDVLAWRRWLEEREIRQPFKQAHREIYVLTDAERLTNVYSNRFAAHILRQHQFNALCAAREWKNQLRLLVDAEYPPATRFLPAWNLRAEFWIEGAGQDYGVDTNDTGTFLRVATDQVRFYPLAAVERRAHAGGGGYSTRGPEGTDTPIALAQIPPLVFSEIMRDVDLFVGVASVGNDPTWADGGPEGRYLTYWQGYAFGELGESARTRQQVLARLLPRLKIAERCSFADRFLVVRGDLRTYKIHLGSGNILMEPNDEYLCIVPGRSQAPADKLYLPFEGDQMLAVILSKALFLAADTQIKDPTITRQISR